METANEIRAEMIDAMNNVNDLINMYQQLQNNPIQFLSKRFNIPQNLNDPNAILQHLLNSGQISQSQLNNIMQLRNNPMIQKMFGIR